METIRKCSSKRKKRTVVLFAAEYARPGQFFDCVLMLLKLGDDFNAREVMAHCLHHLSIALFRLFHLRLLTGLQRSITLALLVDQRIQMSEEITSLDYRQDGTFRTHLYVMGCEERCVRRR